MNLHEFMTLLVSKRVSVYWLMWCEKVENYNYYTDGKPLTKKEFEFLKLNCEKFSPNFPQN